MEEARLLNRPPERDQIGSLESRGYPPVPDPRPAGGGKMPGSWCSDSAESL